MNEQEILQAALRIADLADRDAFLKRVCGDREELLERVQRSLAQRTPGVSAGQTKDFDAGYLVAPGALLAGRYKLVEQVGEGGMGTVWLAEQKSPVNRKVAIKLVKAGMDSHQVLARFEAERQALALMDHPNIAKVFDGGMTDAGRPFFAMEYVNGVPFTEYCDEARLSVKDRLRLLIQVCRAVQHAHQKGIIHRDLKPSNILICIYDSKPMPKVIDFGLAKALHQSLTEHSLYTAIGTMVGTPAYMSPEQAERNNLDVDTRTDVYALGVILYELLTGTTPLEREQLKSASEDEVLRLIRQVEPPRPSTRLSGSARLPSIAAQRSSAPRQLCKTLSGDLDWIVMKALDKERGRRYDTVSGLERDIERYLLDESVEARPPSTVYRWRKFIHKNRSAFTIAVAFCLVLFTATCVSVWFAVRTEMALWSEERQRNLAVDRENDAIDAVKRFGDFVAKHPDLKSNPELKSLRLELLKEPIAFFKSITERPQTENDIRTEYLVRIGAAAHELGMLASEAGDEQAALEAYQQALEIHERLVRDEPNSARMLDALSSTLHNLANVYSSQRKYAEAVKSTERKIAIRQRIANLDPTNIEDQAWIGSERQNLAGLLLAGGKNLEAIEEYEKASAIWEKLAPLDPSPPSYRDWAAGTLLSIGSAHESMGKISQAAEKYHKSVEFFEQRTGQFPKRSSYQFSLAESYLALGRLENTKRQPTESLLWFDKAVITLTNLRDGAGNSANQATLKFYLKRAYWARANVLDLLQRHNQAVADWDRGIELCDDAERPSFRALRACAKVQDGKVSEAAAEIEELAQLPNLKADVLYNCACAYTLASGKSAEHEASYRDRAMKLLQMAVEAGWKDAAKIVEDTDLDAIREREDFKKLLLAVEKAGLPGE